MAWFALFSLITSRMTLSHEITCASRTTAECDIHCDETTDCRNQVLDCNIEGTGLDCNVDCSQGCTNTTIHAENSNHLYITSCDQMHCSNMNIFCPQQMDRNNNEPICIIQGENDECSIKSTNIFTKQGFNDFQLRNTNAINTTVYCGETASEHWCTINNNGACDISGDTTCNSLSLSAKPTSVPSAKPTSIIIAVEPLEVTLKPTAAMKHKEGRIEISTTMEMDGNIIEYTIYQFDSRGDIDLEIAILSGVCLLLLVCCVMFCMLWLMKKYQHHQDGVEHEQKQEDALKLSSDLNTDRHIDKNVYGTTYDLEREGSQMQFNRARGSIFSDNLSVITMSYGVQSPSMRHSFNGIMRPFQCDMVSVCNSALVSDWEEETDAAFEDVRSQTNGEVNLKPDEFVVRGENDDDDVYYDVDTPPGTECNTIHKKCIKANV